MRHIIQNAIVDYCNDAEFFPVLYSELGAALGDDAVAPQSVEANEIAATFGEDPEHRLTHRHDYTRWEWELILRFGQEVTLGFFHDAILANPICIPRGDEMPRQAKIRFDSADFKHPPRMGASNGTEARYRFVVVLSPN